MGFNAYEREQDIAAYNLLVAKNKWGRVDKLSNIAAKGGIVDIDEQIAKVMPTASKRAARYIVDAITNKETS